MPGVRRQRGRALELQIERVLDQLNAYTDLVAIRLEVRQARVGGKLVYCKKQPFDYMVIGRGRVWGFDAKECDGPKWYPSKAPDHQRQAMLKMQRNGHRAGFVVRFAGCPFLRWIEDFSRPATPETGSVFDWEMFMQ